MCFTFKNNDYNRFFLFLENSPKLERHCQGFYKVDWCLLTTQEYFHLKKSMSLIRIIRYYEKPFFLDFKNRFNNTANCINL